MQVQVQVKILQLLDEIDEKSEMNGTSEYH